MNDYLIRDSLTGQVLSEAQAADLPPERVVREDLTRVRELKDEIERLTGALRSLRIAFEGGEALLAEARAAIERVRGLLDSDDGTPWEHNGHGQMEGEPECPGCWAAAIHRALDSTQPECTCPAEGPFERAMTYSVHMFGIEPHAVLCPRYGMRAMRPVEGGDRG